MTFAFGGSGAMATGRLRLRFISRRDAEALYRVLADPALYAATGGAPPESAASLAEVLERRERQRSPAGDEVWLNWLVSELDTRQVVGYVQATLTPTRTRIAWVIGTPWQRRGYATEAARALVEWLEAQGAPEVQAAIQPDHVASRKVAGRVGLQPTGDRDDGEDVWARHR